MRTFVMGDIHGAHQAMLQCFERAGFDRDRDCLIQLGDVVDGAPDSFQCVEELLRIKHLIAIKGNHDEWFREFAETGFHPQLWSQGGRSTALSYQRQLQQNEWSMRIGFGYLTLLRPADIPSAHKQFFRSQRLYYIDDQHNCFVHAGFDRHLDFAGQDPETFYWNRDLWYSALSYQSYVKGDQEPHAFRMEMHFREVFIGHTNTQNWGTDQPMNAANIYNVDTGAGHGGRLTIMEVSSKKYWQSDPVSELYGDVSRD